MKPSDINPAIVGKPAVDFSGFNQSLPPVIQPKGPRLNLRAYGANIMLEDMPEELAPEMQDGIFVPESAQRNIMKDPFRVVKVLSVGSNVVGIKEGDQVLVSRVQAQQINHEGYIYWYTSPAGVYAVVGS